MNGILLWLAQGFGAGRCPLAPGTAGSFVGFIWFLTLLVSGLGWAFVAGALFGGAASVWICGSAERLLKQQDPGSVVLDEIIAVPLCFAWWVGHALVSGHPLPPPETFVNAHHWPLSLAVLVLFRVFDIWKPWPIRSSQALPGGWGMTLDDVLAAVYVNLVFLILLAAGVLSLPL